MEFILSILMCLSLPQPVQWPATRIVPLPPPASGPIIVAADQLFVVTSDAPCVLIASPEGKVAITTEHGPVKMRGKFVGGDAGFETRTFTAKTVFVVEPTGSGPVELITVSGDLGSPTIDRRTLILGDGPKPDEPKPPSPAPISAEGLHVLIVVESSDAAKLPPKQVSILTAKSVRDYLDSHCPKVGGTPEWRIWDKDVNTANESPLWRAAFARKRTGVPWIAVSNGKTGYEGPLPGSIEELLALLKRFGGE